MNVIFLIHKFTLSFKNNDYIKFQGFPLIAAVVFTINYYNFLLIVCRIAVCYGISVINRDIYLFDVILWRTTPGKWIKSQRMVLL